MFRWDYKELYKSIYLAIYKYIRNKNTTTYAVVFSLQENNQALLCRFHGLRFFQITYYKT